MLYQKILNKLDEQRGLSDKLAALAGYKTGQALRKSLKENREFGSFQGLINLVQELFPSDEVKMMGEYARTLDPNKQTARYMVEYCELNKLMDTKEYLMEQMLSCSNAQSKEWANVYYIEHEFSKGNIDLNKTIEMYGRINSKYADTLVAKEIYKAYCYSTKQMFNMTYPILIGIENYFESIKDKYIKENFMGRYHLLVSEHFTMNNELDKSRAYCEKIIKEVSIKSLKAIAYLQLGNSYIIDSFEKSYEYFIKAFDYASSINENIIIDIKRSLSFLHNVWNKYNTYLIHESNHVSDRHEIIFSLYNENKINEANEKMNEIDFDYLTDNQKAFNLYLKGRLTGDIACFSESIIYFKKSGDMLFRRLPIIELQKFNIPESVLSALMY